MPSAPPTSPNSCNTTCFPVTNHLLWKSSLLLLFSPLRLREFKDTHLTFDTHIHEFLRSAAQPSLHNGTHKGMSLSSPAPLSSPFGSCSGVQCCGLPYHSSQDGLVTFCSQSTGRSSTDNHTPPLPLRRSVESTPCHRAAIHPS